MFLAFPWCAKTSKAANRRLGGSYSRHRHHGGRRRTKKPAKVGGPPVQRSSRFTTPSIGRTCERPRSATATRSRSSSRSGPGSQVRSRHIGGVRRSGMRDRAAVDVEWLCFRPHTSQRSQAPAFRSVESRRNRFDFPTLPVAGRDDFPVILRAFLHRRKAGAPFDHFSVSPDGNNLPESATIPSGNRTIPNSAKCQRTPAYLGGGWYL